MTETTNHDADELRTLLAAVANGDAAAFERLYRATAAKLFGICLRMLAQRSDAEEVLQEVFVTVWRKAGQYDARLANPLTWLGMLARNRAIDRLRAGAGARGVARIELSEDIAAELSDPSPSTLAAVAAVDEKRRLDHCLGRLDAQRRVLIRTAFFDGATYEELARRCGSPLGTVKSWIRRGLAQLKLCLET
ncbi:MAG: sigma-70 family RNA polymerase sigma factor [Proteobacteria bacterium]|nr:sigma-70 family RNA polymerase sigma factor [Pseudomonadota bacterium]